MKLKPILTEKTLGLAKTGKYTFAVFPISTKNQIKDEVEKLFKVKVVSIRTLKTRSAAIRKQKGPRRPGSIFMKAIVQLSPKDKIEVFETKK